MAVLHGLLDIVAAVAHALGVGSAVRQIRRNTCVITLTYSHWGRRDRIHGMSSHTENPPGIPSFQHIARRGVHWLDLRVATGMMPSKHKDVTGGDGGHIEAGQLGDLGVELQQQGQGLADATSGAENGNLEAALVLRGDRGPSGLRLPTPKFQ